MFNLSINFIENKKTINFNNVSVSFNVDQQQEWVELSNNFLVGYEIILLRIYDYKTRDYKFLFCKNAHIIVKNNHITVNTFSSDEFYIQNKFKKQNDSLLKQVNKKISALLAIEKIGLDIEKIFELKKLKQKQYVLKMIKELSLKKENYEEI
ncbi:MSC_0621 family F1-like ATPase epsilon subunit [Mycoplasma yeatsii]|uniref:MSC_0621 family F1-like ATPase epsilon subunit n=1 Tax=Mycoplasma yeatsii TaxID=51365 RepID=UPI0005B23973|nr:hypothetical protein [Mycoplasma yeatsii]AJM72086.1 hypothetical protein MYE_03195 [Mycoplasma yeatsii GM274B]